MQLRWTLKPLSTADEVHTNGRTGAHTADDRALRRAVCRVASMV